jgi:hypothetical protein
VTQSLTDFGNEFTGVSHRFAGWKPSLVVRWDWCYRTIATPYCATPRSGKTMGRYRPYNVAWNGFSEAIERPSVDIGYTCVSNDRQSPAMRCDGLMADDRARALDDRGVWGAADLRRLAGAAGGPPQAPPAGGGIRGRH